MNGALGKECGLLKSLIWSQFKWKQNKFASFIRYRIKVIEKVTMTMWTVHNTISKGHISGLLA